MVPRELIRIAQRGMALLPSPLMRYQKGARHEMREGMALYSWGMPEPSFNKVAVFDPAPPLKRIRELAESFFGHTAYGVMVQGDDGHSVEEELRSAGWQVFEDEPALIMPSIPAAPPLPAGLEVLRVTNAKTRADFVSVCARGFGAPTAEAVPPPTEEQMDSFTPLEGMLDPDVAVVVGYLDGQPASCALMHRMEEIAAITGVATPPEYRRRGLARALTWAALREGAARGCTCAALNAAGASYHLYAGMGFVPVGNHRTYAAPA